MILKNLELINFRNYKHLDISFSPKLNIIYGDNAQGKTNILEGIFVLCLTKSHRPYVDNNLIKSGEEFLKITGKFKSDILDKEQKILINEKGKNLEINNQKIRKINDYIKDSSIIIFYPEDLNLIKGTPGDRRRFLNIELSQLYNEYIIALNDYNKLLKIRNDYLKKLKLNLSIDINYFNIVTSYLIDKSEIIYRYRKKYFEKINNICTNIYKEISNYDKFKIIYKPNFEMKFNYKEEMLELLKKNYKEEIRSGSTLYGVHKDDYIYVIENNNLKEFGSQGQQRMAILAHKLSEIKIFEEEKKDIPILLLDDVFSELDDKKKNMLLKYITEDMQVIITTTDLNNIDEKTKKSAKLFKIKDGKMEAEE